MIITKPCNIFSDIIENSESDLAVSSLRNHINTYIKKYKNRSRGLWIDGKFTITTQELLFSTHSESDMVRRTDADLILDINRIRRVWSEFSLFSGKIIFELDDSVIKIRCNDAKNLSELINREILKKRA